jgi:hypothetical protein
MNRFFQACCVAGFLALPTAAFGQGAAESGGSYTYAVPLAVVDAGGKPLAGLRAEQLAVKGIPARLELTAEKSPAQVVFLLDVSSSMRWQGREYSSKWQTAKELLAEFVEAADPSQLMSLHAYGERHEVVVPPTMSREVLLARLHELPEPGTAESEMRYGKLTAFTDALKASLETSLGFGDVVLVVADSIRDDSRSKAKLDAVVRMAVERGVRVYFANVQPPFADAPGTVGPRVTTTFPSAAASPEVPRRIESYEMWIHHPGSRPESPVIRRAVEETGGQVLFIWKGATYYYPGRFELPPDGLKEVAQDALASISAVYRLELSLDTALPKKRKIEVNLLDGGKKRSDVRVYHPRYLFPTQH